MAHIGFHACLGESHHQARSPLQHVGVRCKPQGLGGFRFRNAASCPTVKHVSIKRRGTDVAEWFTGVVSNFSWVLGCRVLADIEPFVVLPVLILVNYHGRMIKAMVSKPSQDD